MIYMPVTHQELLYTASDYDPNPQITCEVKEILEMKLYVVVSKNKM